MPSYLSIVHRLNAEKVSGDKQGLVGPVPDGKAEHSPQTVQQVLPPFLEAVNQHLGVRIRGEDMPLFLKLLTKLLIIIDFPVEHKHQGLVLIINRLASVIQVDNAQPAKAHGNLVVGIKPLAVRSPVGNDLRHVFQNIVTVDDLTGESA